MTFPNVRKSFSISIKTSRLSANQVYQHRVRPFKLLDSAKPGHRKTLALFLIDPHYPIISTSNIPCQQKTWWADEIRYIGPLGALPPEIVDEITKVNPDPS